MVVSKHNAHLGWQRDIYYAKYYGKGGGMVSWGKKIKNKSWGEKMKKGKERKGKENCIKKGEKALKMHFFWL